MAPVDVCQDFLLRGVSIGPFFREVALLVELAIQCWRSADHRVSQSKKNEVAGSVRVSGGHPGELPV